MYFLNESFLNELRTKYVTYEKYIPKYKLNSHFNEKNVEQIETQEFEYS